MAWNLAAAGECARELEEQLAAEIRAVLGRAEYGTQRSSLNGEAVRQDPVHGASFAPPAATGVPDA